MATGFTKPGISSQIKWYYLRAASLPARLANVGAVDSLVITANQVIGTTADPVLPAIRGGGDATGQNYITWREHGATSVNFIQDIADNTPGQAAGAGTTFDLTFQLDTTNAIHNALVMAPRGTYAQMVADIRMADGDGTIGTAAGNARGSAIAMVVQHADAPITLPSSATPISATVTFTIVQDSAGMEGRQIFHYGPP